MLRSRHSSNFKTAKPVAAPAVADAERRGRSNGKAETVIRPERFARLVTLAGMLIGSARNDRHAAHRRGLRASSGSPSRSCASDIDVLNVVNFGGGTYVLYAEVVGDEIEVDPEAYGDSFAKPGPAAAARGEGARRRDRLLRRPPAAGRPRHRPREDRRRARPRPLRGGPADHDRAGRARDRQRRQRRDRRPRRC